MDHICSPSDTNKDSHYITSPIPKDNTEADVSKGTVSVERRPKWYVAGNHFFQKCLKVNINPVSFIGQQNYNPYSDIPTCAEDTTDLERGEDPSKFCRQCKQLNSYCHRVVYQDFIKKRIFADYMNQIKKPSFNEIKEAMKEAYNEKRRVEYHKEFGFVDKEKADLPECLMSYSYKMRSLLYEVAEATKINYETRQGVCKCVAAKRMQMC